MTLSARPLTHAIVVGTSEPQDFELLNDGAAFDGSGFTVTLAIRSMTAGVALPGTLPTVAWLSQAGGTVRVSGVDTLEVAAYAVRFHVTDGGSFDGYFPNGADPDTWRVVRV